MSDGAGDLAARELREIEEDAYSREPVIIIAKILKFDWQELARI
jgi:hypothetical protein